LRALAAFAFYFLVSSYLPLLWPKPWRRCGLFDLAGGSTAAAVAAGVLGYELAAYGWHRAMHAFTPLWRLFHQMHHRSERLDVVSAFWFSPLDMVAWTLLPSVTLTILGVPPAARR
jgi:sterol desaturase/sphingolipid hydroxylase (fatty acid hydroxylase superfamily)